MGIRVLGFDIGGANIKASDADGSTHTVAFPMWTDYSQLSSTLAGIARDHFAPPDMIAVTMTAELADCFPTKAQGVSFVVDAVCTAFPQAPSRFWLTTGEFATADDACELPTLVAAANWHALATWVGRGVPTGPAILLDVGSTTTDIIPLFDGRPVSTGLSDVERLLAGELVYCGVGRTPVSSIVRTVPLRQQLCPVAAEHFATIADAFLVAGVFEEDDTACDTADGRAFTVSNSRNRLAHMVCCDQTELTVEELDQMADAIVEQAVALAVNALHQVRRTLASEYGDTPPAVICSGSGAFFAERVVQAFADAEFGDRLLLPQMAPDGVAESACAFAVARLAHDRCRDDLLDVTAF
ncbi:MAG: hypothetical protein NXI04_17270 [Planctomycetaceae bacterium]|nr:hypothetical protein [Planctomycetaceae bacterium]